METSLSAYTLLQAYLNEFVFRFNRRFYPFTSFRSLLGIAGGAESPDVRRAFQRGVRASRG